MTTGGLDDLHRISQTGLDRDLAELRAVARDVDAVRAEIAALEREMTAQKAYSTEFALQYEGWLVWATRRRRALNEDLARRRAMLEVRKEAARKSFGRTQVLADLMAEAKDRARQKRARSGRTG